MGKKRQIIHLVHFSSRPGGIEVLIPVFINAMPECEFQGYVIRKPDHVEPNVYDSLNIPVEYGSDSNPKAILKVFVYAFKHRKNIFQVFNIGPIFLFVLRLAGVKKLIYSIHGTIYWKTKWQRIFFKLFWKLALRKNYKITSNTEYSKKVFLEKINQKSTIQVLFNPVNGKKFTPVSNAKETGNLKIIYVGRLNKGKNLETWIDIASQLHKSLPNTQFEIYGSGPLYKPLLIKIEALNAASYVSLKGFRHDVENVFRKADLLVFLSEYESFGNVVVESILCGTPAIVSDIPSMREIFTDFPEFIVKVDDNLYQAVHTKLLSINKLKEKALEAREGFLYRFSIESHTNTLNKLYQSFNE